MNHPHSDQSVHHVCRRRPAFGPHTHLVNASVSPLDHHSSVRIRTQHNDDSGLHPVVDGALITSTLVIPDANTTLRPVTPAPVNPVNPPVPVVEPEPGVLRRVVDDPYWALVTLMATLAVSITATVAYGVTQITLLVAQWLGANGGTVATVIVIVLLAVCAGGTTARCAGIHCGGCKR
jgi:hypothetical protein